VLGVVPDDAAVKRVIDHVILPAVGHPAADRSAPPKQKARTS